MKIRRQIQLEADDDEKLREIAHKERKSIARIIREALQNYLSKNSRSA